MVKTLLYILTFVVATGGIFTLILFYLGGYGVLTTFYVYLIALLFSIMFVKISLRKSKPLLQNLELSLYVLFVCLFVIELSLRYITKTNLNYCEANGSFFCFDQRAIRLDYLARKFVYKDKDIWGYTQKNKSVVKSTPEYTYEHRYNSMGFRCSELDTGNIKIILTLGDSFTEGVGTPQDSTYPETLLRILKKQHPEKKYSLINAGKAGNDILAEYMMFKHSLIGFKPDIVLILLNNTDINDIAEKGGLERFDPNGMQHFPGRPWWSPLAEVSLIFRTFVMSGLGYNFSYLNPSEEKQRKAEAETQIVNVIINKLHPLASAYHSKLFIIYQPILSDFEKDGLANIKSRLSHHPEINTIDLLPLFKQDIKHNRTTLKELYWPIDLHFKPAGYIYLANKIYPQLATYLNSDTVGNTIK